MPGKRGKIFQKPNRRHSDEKMFQRDEKEGIDLMFTFAAKSNSHKASKERKSEDAQYPLL